mgnify:CR=1 FL=1
MKTLISFIQNSFRGSNPAARDSVRDFFVKGSVADKKPLYEEALRAAQADQRKVLECARAL